MSRIVIRRYFLYLARWQLSTPILALCIYFFQFGGTVVATIMANLIGGLLFFWVDRYIFKSDWFEVWQTSKGICDGCGKVSNTLFRLVRAPGYNRLDSQPVFLCMECSSKKTAALRKKGIPVKGRSL
jgi:hypothetical protein